MDKAANDMRFRMELEFVQCLSNPLYLTYLAQEGLLFDADFQRYLAYLHGYWTKPEYACHLAYPYCLSLLKLLQDPVFCQACVSADTATLLHRKEYAEWTAGQKRLQRLVGSIPDVVESEDSAMAPIPNEPPSAL